MWVLGLHPIFMKSSSFKQDTEHDGDDDWRTGHVDE